MATLNPAPHAYLCSTFRSLQMNNQTLFRPMKVQEHGLIYIMSNSSHGGNMRRLKLSQPLWQPKRILLQFNKHLVVTIGKQSAYCDWWPWWGNWGLGSNVRVNLWAGSIILFRESGVKMPFEISHAISFVQSWRNFTGKPVRQDSRKLAGVPFIIKWSPIQNVDSSSEEEDDTG